METKILTVHDVPFATMTREPGLLGRMFEWRKELNNAYFEKEKLPSYPLNDLSDRNSQTFLRDLIGYAQEEIFEAYEQMETIAVGIEVGHLGEFTNHVRQFNEELPDINHFLLELMLFINIEAEDVESYYKTLLTEKNLKFGYQENSTLFNALSYARYVNGDGGFKNREINKASFVIPVPEGLFYTCGKRISLSSLPYHKLLLFEVLKNLNNMRCQLKNKYWKEQENATSAKELQLYMMEAWLAWVCYMEFIGADEFFIYQSYYKKHRVNLDRINKGY